MDSNGNGEKRKTYAEIADTPGKAEGEIRASFNNIAKDFRQLVNLRRPVRSSYIGRTKMKVVKLVALIVIVMLDIAAFSTGCDTAAYTQAENKSGPILPDESSLPVSAELILNDTVVTAPDAVLPGHVYVLNNSEIVTEKPSGEMDELYGTESSSYRGRASHSATIRASVTVTPSRMIVVDENDRIIEIWSNTTGTKRYFYSLRVKEQSWEGPEHLLTLGILAQYNYLLNEVDWTNNGRVY